MKGKGYATIADRLNEIKLGECRGFLVKAQKSHQRLVLLSLILVQKEVLTLWQTYSTFAMNVRPLI